METTNVRVCAHSPIESLLGKERNATTSHFVSDYSEFVSEVLDNFNERVFIMEKRIFGRRYNTDTAKLVAFNESKSLGLDYYFESVYRKRNGEYFFYASGNAASVYADYEGGVYTCGYVLIPLRNKDVDTIVKVVDGCELDKRDYKCPGIDDCGRFDWFYYCTVVHSECDPNMFRC